MAEETKTVSLAAELAAVFVAGGAGATLRVLLAGRVDLLAVERLPHAGVLLANLIGCLLIGLASASIASAHWRSVVLGGLLGGFTTYSAFALFSVGLVQQQRWGVLATQIASHLIGGVVCVWLGFWLARTLGLGIGTSRI